MGGRCGGGEGARCLVRLFYFLLGALFGVAFGGISSIGFLLSRVGLFLFINYAILFPPCQKSRMRT